MMTVFFIRVLNITRYTEAIYTGLLCRSRLVKIIKGTEKNVELGETSGIGFKTFNALKKYLGRAGDSFAWHHIVEQTPVNIANSVKK